MSLDIGSLISMSSICKRRKQFFNGATTTSVRESGKVPFQSEIAVQEPSSLDKPVSRARRSTLAMPPSALNSWCGIDHSLLGYRQMPCKLDKELSFRLITGRCNGEWDRSQDSSTIKGMSKGDTKHEKSCFWFAALIMIAIDQRTTECQGGA